jgi:tRNA(Ile)-lysidine synthase
MSDRILAEVAGALDAHALRGRRLCIGLSGGVDSIVLMDTLDRLRAEYQLDLSALHVNHGISAHAGEWQDFCVARCEARGIPLDVRAVTVVDDGSGIEACARALRHRAYAQMPADCVVLGHHLDDQAETFLLQLLRGAGPKGLAAMPAWRPAGAGTPAMLRPMLGIRRDEIEVHARSRGLAWVTDESNAEARYDRNFLRNEVLPLLQARFPGYRETLSRAARNMADHLQLAEELAAIDAADAPVSVQRLRGLSDARALNLLRHLFALRGLPMPPRSQLEEGLRQCRGARADAQVRVDFGTHALRCYRGTVELVGSDAAPPSWQASWDGRHVLQLPASLGRLHPRPATGSGIAARHFDEQPALVRGRSGGESMRPVPAGPSRTLKNLMQENAVPPWERARMPLVFFGDRLAWVPGIGVAAEFRAGAAEAGIEPEWDRSVTSPEAGPR